jgi:hypothetical protein
MCPDKESLYNIGKKPSRIIPFAWVRIAAAAAVIITGGLLWMNAGNKKELTGGAQQQIAATSRPGGQTGGNISRDLAATNYENISSPGKAVASADKQEAGYRNNADQKDEVKITAKKSAPMPEPAPDVDARPVLQEPAATIVRVPEQQVKAQPVYEATLAPQENIKKKESAPVKPVILDAAAFNGDRDITVADQKETEDMHYLSTNDDDKRSKGKFRGLFRKASRLIDRVTNAGTEDEKSIVRVASFEIVKK